MAGLLGNIGEMVINWIDFDHKPGPDVDRWKAIANNTLSVAHRIDNAIDQQPLISAITGDGSDGLPSVLTVIKDISGYIEDVVHEAGAAELERQKKAGEKAVVEPHKIMKVRRREGIE